MCLCVLCVCEMCVCDVCSLLLVCVVCMYVSYMGMNRFLLCGI